MGVRGLTELDLTAALEGLARRDFTARELVEAYLAKVDRDDSLVRAYVPLSEAESESLRVEALRAANAADAARKAGRPMPLGGIPVAVKDTYLVEGVRTTFGSGDHVVPQTSALAWQRLSAAGAVLIGKSTTHEYAFGTASGATRNPWDLRRVPGGSSGGSAAALSARMALVALGTDTGGSLRIPAAACGISTLRPTPGRVPVQGTFPLSRTLDVAGPMARRMRDLGTVMAVLTSGEDPSWPASLPDEGLLHGLRIGVAPVISWEGVHDGIAEVCRQALKELERRGAEIIDIPTPYVGRDLLSQAMPIFDTINTFEAWQVHSTRRRKAQEALVRARVNLGQRIQENDYRAALFMRREFGLQWRSLMEDHHLDVIAHPTIDALPNFVDPARPGAGPDIRLSVPWSLAGFPVLSVPAGATSGLPVGLSLAGLPGEDAKLWQIGVLMDEYIGLWKSAPEITPPKAFVWPKLSAAQS